jgi:lysozyme family protein
VKVEQIIDGIIRTEGGYSNNPADTGGATKYGITEKVARAHGYTGDMKDLPRDLAYNIYLQTYWLEPGLDKVAQLSEAIAEEVCDTGVNCGVNAAKPMLQRALNALNRQGRDFADIATDGQIGPGTLSALATFLAKRGKDGEAVLLRVLNSLQCVRYLEISEKRPANEEFFFGWVLNRVVI